MTALTLGPKMFKISKSQYVSLYIHKVLSYLPSHFSHILFSPCSVGLAAHGYMYVPTSTLPGFPCKRLLSRTNR